MLASNLANVVETTVLMQPTLLSFPIHMQLFFFLFQLTFSLLVHLSLPLCFLFVTAFTSFLFFFSPLFCYSLSFLSVSLLLLLSFLTHFPELAFIIVILTLSIFTVTLFELLPLIAKLMINAIPIVFHLILQPQRKSTVTSVMQPRTIFLIEIIDLIFIFFIIMMVEVARRSLPPAVVSIIELI